MLQPLLPPSPKELYLLASSACGRRLSICLEDKSSPDTYTQVERLSAGKIFIAKMTRPTGLWIAHGAILENPDTAKDFPSFRSVGRFDGSNFNGDHEGMFRQSIREPSWFDIFQRLKNDEPIKQFSPPACLQNLRELLEDERGPQKVSCLYPVTLRGEKLKPLLLELEATEIIRQARSCLTQKPRQLAPILKTVQFAIRKPLVLILATFSDNQSVRFNERCIGLLCNRIIKSKNFPRFLDFLETVAPNVTTQFVACQFAKAFKAGCDSDRIARSFSHIVLRRDKENKPSPNERNSRAFGRTPVADFTGETLMALATVEDAREASAKASRNITQLEKFVLGVLSEYSRYGAPEESVAFVSIASAFGISSLAITRASLAVLESSTRALGHHSVSQIAVQTGSYSLHDLATNLYIKAVVSSGRGERPEHYETIKRYARLMLAGSYKDNVTSVADMIAPTKVEKKLLMLFLEGYSVLEHFRDAYLKIRPVEDLADRLQCISEEIEELFLLEMIDDLELAEIYGKIMVAIDKFEGNWGRSSRSTPRIFARKAMLFGAYRTGNALMIKDIETNFEASPDSAHPS